jgi:hypothetical protein
LFGGGDRLGILVESDQAALGRQLRQDQPAMTAAAERAIYISTGCARAFEAERIDCFIKQHRAML